MDFNDIKKNGFSNVDPYDEELFVGGQHVTILFWDGEVILTKGGELFRMRSEHQVERPLTEDEDLVRDVMYLFKNEYNGYKCIFIKNETEEKIYRDYLKGLIDGKN